MRQTDRRGVSALGTCGAIVALVLAGAGPLDKDKDKKKAEPPLKVEETVGDLADVVSAKEIRVEGVGLVIGLDGTGSDPEPSYYRAQLLNEMRKAGVHDAESKYFKSGTTSLVLVKARIPTGVGPKDPFDVVVELTPASTTKSLAGGFLMRTRLSVQGMVKGEVLQGQEMASAYGPVLIGSAAKPDDPRVGRVLGGGRVKKEVPYTLVIRDNRKSAKTAGLLQGTINTRFHQSEGIDQKLMANAKTPQYLVLNVPHVYHQNQARFFQVVRFLPVVDKPELRAMRQERWGKELLDPRTAGIAALKLEGIGRNAIGILQKGLSSPDADVRFFAAEALAYLGDESGVDVLARAAIEQPKFRAHALAAMAAMDQQAASMRLRELMSQPDPQVRYGAFNALRLVDEQDPILGRVRLLRDEPEPEPDEAMAVQIARPRRRTPRPQDPFQFYVVDCDGPPMVHVSNSRRCEIVVFGKGQRLLPPVVLGGAGSLLLNANDGDERVQVSRITKADAGGPERTVTCPAELREVVAAMANLQATYPEIVGLLQAAARQRNLPGPLVVDTVPIAVPAYDEAQLSGLAPKKDEAVGRAGFDKPRRRLLDRLRLPGRD
jgi:flagellar basal body P-ring protein FlgI